MTVCSSNWRSSWIEPRRRRRQFDNSTILKAMRLADWLATFADKQMTRKWKRQTKKEQTNKTNKQSEQ